MEVLKTLTGGGGNPRLIDPVKRSHMVVVETRLPMRVGMTGPSLPLYIEVVGNGL